MDGILVVIKYVIVHSIHLITKTLFPNSVLKLGAIIEMAAYAALVSLMTTLNNIQIHPHVSAFFNSKQIQSLHQIISVLLDFIESGNSHGGSKEVEALESRVVSTAHAAEDVIESHLVNQILAGSSDLLDLETEIEAMNSVEETVMEFRGTIKFKDEESSCSMSAASSKPTTKKKDLMVGFDEKLIQVMERLIGLQPGLQIISIVGMGGIGKTTLAKKVYDSLLTVESFDIRAWVTVSQDYSVKHVLSELLSCIKDQNINKSIGAVGYGTSLETEDHQLGLELYQSLWGRRYLIVLDDMWSVEAWEVIKFYFPNNEDRSRVVITTRISSVAAHLSSSSIEMNFLDEDQSWELFCEHVYLEKGCPPEIEKIGRKIVRECKGLPLLIVVVGGLLRNSRITHEYWKDFARDLNSILMSGNDEHCLKILSLSYNHLPAHLKSCFLYMGVFKEDVRIRVSQLTKLFVAEGFIKPKDGQTLEEVANDYVNDLVDRNLIIVESWRWNGGIKYFKMHDAVREVCLRIGERKKIFHRMKMFGNMPAYINGERRIVFDGPPNRMDLPEVFDALQSASLARTFLYSDSDRGPLPFKFRLLRVLRHIDFQSMEDICQHVNLRYLKWSLNLVREFYAKLSSSVSLLWNVHTLIIDKQVEAPSEIWYMRQLRHLQFYRIFLRDPPPPPSEKVEQQDDDVLLPNLQTLSTLVNFSFSEEVCKRMPNIKKLGIGHEDLLGNVCAGKCYYYLNHLHKLQSLNCSFAKMGRDDLLQRLLFPSSLMKLTLKGCGLHWEDLNTFGLSLPHLQVLKLRRDAVVGPEWDCVEGAFPRLKILHICHVDLIKWTAESSSFFPVLEKLQLYSMEELERIPSSIGEIQTLENLRVDWCSLSSAISSIEILEEQLSLGNEDLQLVLHTMNAEEKSLLEKQLEMKSITTKNFKFGSAWDYFFSINDLREFHLI